MEQQKLPNSTLILVFGIISIVLCCCYGLGIILGIIAIVLASKAIKTYNENPEQYSGYKNVTTGRILAIVGVSLSAIWLAYVIYMYATLGADGMQQMSDEMMREWGMEGQ